MASAIDSLNLAISRTGRICFKPFSFGVWMAMALMAFLSGGGGGNFNFNLPGRWSSSGTGSTSHPGAAFDEWRIWFYDHMFTILIVGGIILIAVLLLLVLFTWLNCRAKFVLIDQIVQRHGRIVEPWKAIAPQARSLFYYLMIFGPIFLIGYALIAGLGLLIAWPDIQSQLFTSYAISAIIFGMLSFLVFSLFVAMVNAVVYLILVPVMYFHRIKMMEAYRVFKTHIMPGNIGQILLFFVMKIVIGIGIGIASMIVGVCTCCIGFLPYINTVLTLPAHVFNQAYDLYFVAGFFNGNFFVGDEISGFPVENVRPAVAPIQTTEPPSSENQPPQNPPPTL